MLYSTLLTTALSVAAVIAAPVEKRVYSTEVIVVVETIYTTVYPTAAASSTPAAPLAALQSGGWGGRHSRSRRTSSSTRAGSSTIAPTLTRSSVVVTSTAAPTTSQAPAPTEPSTTRVITSTSQEQPSTTAAQTTSPAQTGSPTAGACPAYTAVTDFSSPPTSCGISVLDTLNRYRTAYGLKTFTWNEQMAKNSWNTLTANQGGVTMNHHLVSPSNGEIITPGFFVIGDLKTEGDTPFEAALVAWLCEVSSDPQLQASGFTGIDQCNIGRNVAGISGSANKDEPTGHHDILLGNYSSVGCEYMQKAGLKSSDDARWTGQWTCNFKI